MKKIVSFDLDMTLLNHANYKIPDSALYSIKKIKESGHIFAISTGRDMDNYYSKSYIDLLEPDAIIDTNGTRVKYGDIVIYKSLFDKKLLYELLNFCINNNLSIGVSDEKYDYYTNQENIIKYDIDKWGKSYRNFGNYKYLFDSEIRTLAYIGKPNGAKMIEDKFPQLKLPLFSNNSGADIIQINDSKANGLKYLANYLNIDMKNTIAFGDSMNDYEILQEAGIGVAMGNANDILKLIANYVTEDIDKDGIFKACQFLGLFIKEEI